MANLARSVHSSNDHFQRKTENSKKREAREEKRKGVEEGIDQTFSSSNLELYLF